VRAKILGWHRHGENNTYMYVLSGEGRLDSGPGGKDSVDLKPSDAALIPAHTIHREVTGTAELTGFVVRVGRGSLVFPADGPE
jgi:mannose-6-phosphate isomerase-like protein (cupin superfamily)